MVVGGSADTLFAAPEEKQRRHTDLPAFLGADVLLARARGGTAGTASAPATPAAAHGLPPPLPPPPGSLGRVRAEVG